MPEPRLITFDVYMALLDIQGSLIPVFADAAGVDQKRASAIVATWRSKQMERAASSNSLDNVHTPFRHCTALALDYVCSRHSLTIKSDRRDLLVQAWATLTPWPEADAALAAVKAKGYEIAILSNGDQDMLESVATQFTTDFDHVLSAETARNYKPHPSVYALPESVLGVRKEDTWHVAGSANDVLGAVSFGMTCVWSNKSGDALLDPAYPPTHHINNLAELPSLL